MIDIIEHTETRKSFYSENLRSCLDYIGKFTASIVIFHLLDLRIIDLLSNGPMVISHLANESKVDEGRLRNLLIYCRNEGIVDFENDVVALSDLGKAIEKCKGWFEMLVGGYGETFFQIGEVVKDSAKLASRNTKYVSRGSCLISQYDAIPLTKSLMKIDVDKECLILDLGCGNGLYLSLFCKELPKLKAIGVEPAQDSFEDALKEIEKNNLSDRIKLYNQDSVSFFESYNGEAPDYIIFAFVLHEILAQEEYEGVLQFLRKIKERFATSKVIIIEVENVFSNKETMQDGIERGYYNPYYLLHTITNQRLEKKPFWRNLFQDAGYCITEELTADESVDPSKLEVGFLLEP